MALSFMLNPRGGSRKRKRAAHARRRAPKWMSKKVKNMTFTQCMAAASYRKKGYKCRTAKDKALARKAAAAARRLKSKKQVGEYGDALGVIQLNPRRKRKNNGGRKMAATKRKRRRKSTKRSRAGKKAWRTRLRRYSKKRSSVGRRGYKNNPRRKRRRNAWRDDAAGHRKAAKKGWRRRKAGKGKKRSNPRGRRRRNSMYSGRLYANPRRRRNARRGRRRNASRLFANPNGMLGSVTRTLTSPDSLMQFAAGAAGASVSGLLGAYIAGKIAGFAPATFPSGGMASNLLNAAASIASGILVASFLPSKFRAAWVLGSGVVAVHPIISGAMKPALAPLASALGVSGLAGPRGGIGGWISAAEVYGTRGMGAWLSAQQMPGVGVAGLRGGRSLGYSRNYTDQPGMQSAFVM